MSEANQAEEKQSIQVAVVGTNANGDADVYHCVVVCTASEVALGVHYEMAEKVAREGDFVPMLSVDATEPMWAILSKSSSEQLAEQKALEAYKRFALETVGDFQDAFMPGQECDGGDLVERLGNHLRRFITVGLPDAGVALKLTYGYTEEGYVDGGSGGIFAPDDVPSFTVLPEEIERLKQVVAEGGGVLIEPSAAAILGDVAAETPSVAQLQEAAKWSRDRAVQHGFKISRNNAVEVMQHELELSSDSMAPEAFSPVLAMAVLAAPQAETLRNLPRG